MPPPPVLSLRSDIMKGSLATGVSPIPATGIFDDDGMVVPSLRPQVASFARLVQARFGNRAVMPIDLIGQPDLAPAYQRLALAGNLMDDLLRDPATRIAVGATA